MCRIQEDLSAETEFNIHHDVFMSVKSPETENHTAMFLQWPRTDKLALERAFHVFMLKWQPPQVLPRAWKGRGEGRGGEGRGGVFSWLQSVTSPLDATKSYKLVL